MTNLCVNHRNISLKISAREVLTEIFLFRPSQLNLALVWAYSLSKSGSSYPKIVITTANMTREGRSKLELLGCEIMEAAVIPKPPAPKGPGGRTFRADRENVFTKLWIWNMTYSSIIFMDSDTLVLQNIDHLFEMEEVKHGYIAAVFYCDIQYDAFGSRNLPPLEIFRYLSTDIRVFS
jgi:alpha-N-acetylglucosamine transferase